MTTETATMTLLEAFRLANRRRARLAVRRVSGNLGTGRSEDQLAISPSRTNGFIAFQQGLTSDWHWLNDDQARQVIVERA